jgi:MFS family permease
VGLKSTRSQSHLFARALRVPTFRDVLAGSLVSNIGSWMQNVARDWLVFILAGPSGKLYLGINAFAEGASLALMLPLGGVLADRHSRKSILIATNLLSAGVALLLAVLAATRALAGWHIVALTALNGAFDGFRIPANQTLLADLVDKDDVPNAIALNSMQYNLSRVVGPVMGGLTLFYVGATWSFLLNALSFLAILFALRGVSSVSSAARTTESVVTSLRQGVGYVRRRTDLTLIIVMVVAIGLCSAPVTKLLPALASEVFASGERGFSALLASFGAGAVIGAVALAARPHGLATPTRALPLLLTMGLAELGLVGVHHFSLAVALLAISGVTFVGAMVQLNSAVLQSTPDHVRGRAASLHTFAFRVGLPLGGFVAGWLAHLSSIRSAYAVFGVLMVLAVPLVLLLARHRAAWL